MKTKKTTKKPEKNYYLGLRITQEYQEKLEQRRIQQGDDNLSQTARRILYRELDNQSK